MAAELPGWEAFEFRNNDISHPVFVRGKGPGVVLIHELPGLTRQCVALAERLVVAGYCVFMPLLFGRPNEDALLRNTLRMCISREIWIFRSRQTSPVVDWLRALCRKTRDQCGGPGVGVIGMCLTGNFAIALLADECVLAPVTCQPSLPLGFSGSARELAMSPEDLDAVKTRARKLEITLLGFRFNDDRICRTEKFERIKEELGSQFDANTLPGAGHCVLTHDFIDESGHPTKQALEKTLRFLDQRLHARAS
jgi:dienelactone hydrolase